MDVKVLVTNIGMSALANYQIKVSCDNPAALYQEALWGRVFYDAVLPNKAFDGPLDNHGFAIPSEDMSIDWVNGIFTINAPAALPINTERIYQLRFGTSTGATGNIGFNVAILDATNGIRLDNPNQFHPDAIAEIRTDLNKIIVTNRSLLMKHFGAAQSREYAGVIYLLNLAQKRALADGALMLYVDREEPVTIEWDHDEATIEEANNLGEIVRDNIGALAFKAGMLEKPPPRNAFYGYVAILGSDDIIPMYREIQYCLNGVCNNPSSLMDPINQWLLVMFSQEPSRYPSDARYTHYGTAQILSEELIVGRLPFWSLAGGLSLLKAQSFPMRDELIMLQTDGLQYGKYFKFVDKGYAIRNDGAPGYSPSTMHQDWTAETGASAFNGDLGSIGGVFLGLHGSTNSAGWRGETSPGHYEAFSISANGNSSVPDGEIAVDLLTNNIYGPGNRSFSLASDVLFVSLGCNNGLPSRAGLLAAALFNQKASGMVANTCYSSGSGCPYNSSRTSYNCRLAPLAIETDIQYEDSEWIYDRILNNIYDNYPAKPIAESVLLAKAQFRLMNLILDDWGDFNQYLYSIVNYYGLPWIRAGAPGSASERASIEERTQQITYRTPMLSNDRLLSSNFSGLRGTQSDATMTIDLPSMHLEASGPYSRLVSDQSNLELNIMSKPVLPYFEVDEIVLPEGAQDALVVLNNVTYAASLTADLPCGDVQYLNDPEGSVEPLIIATYSAFCSEMGLYPAEQNLLRWAADGPQQRLLVLGARHDATTKETRIVDTVTYTVSYTLGNLETSIFNIGILPAIPKPGDQIGATFTLQYHGSLENASEDVLFEIRDSQGNIVASHEALAIPVARLSNVMVQEPVVSSLPAGDYTLWVRLREGSFTGSAYRFVFQVKETDADGDGLTDDEENAFGSDPSNPDTDGDGLGDREERQLGTDPNDTDSDNDGFTDGYEVDLGSDPMSVASAPPVGPALVADGTFGVPMTVRKINAAGSQIELSWDTSCGGTTDYGILYGTGSQLPAVSGGTYQLTGSVCGLSSSLPYSWNNSLDPAADPSGFYWWVIVATDGASTEGSWGGDSSGAERNGAGTGGASNQCATLKDTSNRCRL